MKWSFTEGVFIQGKGALSSLDTLKGLKTAFCPTETTDLQKLPAEVSPSLSACVALSLLGFLGYCCTLSRGGGLKTLNYRPEPLLTTAEQDKFKGI